MLSTDKPSPNPSDRVLSATLRQVQGRRRRRRRLMVAGASMVTIALVAMATFFGEPPSSPSAPRPGSKVSPLIAAGEVAIEDETKSDSAIAVIQRITATDGSATGDSRIQRISRPASIERLSGDSPSPRLVESISEGQLFAAFPEEQSVALLKKPDGSSRLFLLEKTRDAR